MQITKNVLAFLNIFLSSILVHFKNISEYLKRRNTQLFIYLMRFLLQSLVSRSFLFCLWYSFVFFSFHFWSFDGACFQYSQALVIFLFSKHSDSFPIWQFHVSVISLFSFFIIILVHFSMPNLIPISWLYIRSDGIRVSKSYSFLQTAWYRPYI